MSKQHRTLKWKNSDGAEMPHELRVEHDSTDNALRVLLLLKKQTPSTMEIVIPQADLSDFMTSWNTAHQNWIEHNRFIKDGEYFFAIRVVNLKGSRFVVWRAEHIEGHAYDLLSVYHGTLAEMLNH